MYRTGRAPPAPPVRSLLAAGRSRFYWCYFQEPSAAETEFERDVDHTLRRILCSLKPDDGGGPVDPDKILMLPEGDGFLDMLRRPEWLPDWLGNRNSP